MQLTRYTEDVDDCTTTLDATGMVLVTADPQADVAEARARARRGDLAGAEFWLGMALEARNGR